MQQDYTTAISTALVTYANDGEGLFRELKSIHNNARQAGDAVVYPANQIINLTIPSNGESIVLSKETDFNNCSFYVTNFTKPSFNLFYLGQLGNPVTANVSKSMLTQGATVQDTGSLITSHPTLLIVEDANEWTKYDNGTLSPVKRKDVIYVKNNIAQNSPISTYNNTASSPVVSFYNLQYTGSSEQPIARAFSNINFFRTPKSTCITNLLYVKGMYDITIENVIVNTPLSSLTGDFCIKVVDSAKLKMKHITINQTYSSETNFGYGIYLDNVWDSQFEHISSSSIWGVFATNNTNIAELQDCHINRFDIHCYGRDVTCIRCSFRNGQSTNHTYNRFSSLFGTLRYVNCFFYKFRPIRFDSQYMAFTPFNLIMENCSVTVSPDWNCLFDAPYINTVGYTVRPELQNICLPNVTITNLTLIVPSGISTLYFFKIYSHSYTGDIYNMSQINIQAPHYMQESSVNIYDANYSITLHEQLTATYTIKNTDSTLHNVTQNIHN